MGASHTAHGINPKYLEEDHLKIYNFSRAGAGPSFNLKWYKRIFQLHYPKPIFVIYGVHWYMFDERVIQRKVEQDSKYFPYDFLLSEFRDLETFKILLLNRFAFIRERKQLAERLLRGTEQVMVLSKYYNGFIPYERKGRLDKKKDMMPKNSEAEIRAFKELLDEFERNRIEVIFVQVPGYLPARNGLNIEEGLKLINEIAEKRKILFLDYDTRRITNINTDRSMYSDWLHLNEKGSDAFSKLLKSDLEFLLKQRPAKVDGPSVRSGLSNERKSPAG
jgi:lysophospholipase L1-like esterase